MTQTHHFTCTLLSKVVLSARAATEGQVDSLDYIPGAKFMGILAKGYTGFDDDTARHDLFHNGKVRFSNAYPLADGHRFYPAPLSYFAEKGSKITNSDIYLDHLMEPDARSALSKGGIQTKQVRKGFVDAAGENYLTIETNYQLKSAYDADKRRSKDSQMYGYFSIPKGTVFSFMVEDTTGNYGEQIKKALQGEHGIGRSRTAEYGRVSIEATNAPKADNQTSAAMPKTLAYAVSDLCFHDDFGQAKQPTAQDLGFEKGTEIDWERTQVRSGEYQSWNSTRWNRNADRWVIKKGSVFCLKEVAKNVDTGINWVGSLYQEGFGQVWINPPFLQATPGAYQRPKLSKVELTTASAPEPETNAKLLKANTGLLDLLNRRSDSRNRDGDIHQRVNNFLTDNKKDFKNISRSQWSTLRSYASHAANGKALTQLIFDEKTGFLHRGQSEKSWRSSRDKLRAAVEGLNENDQPLFLQKLAAEMAKRTKNQPA